MDEIFLNCVLLSMILDIALFRPQNQDVNG